MDRSRLFTRLGTLGEDDDRQAVYDFWDQAGDTARFEAAWEMVVFAMKMKGTPIDDLRLQRSVTKLVRKQS